MLNTLNPNHTLRTLYLVRHAHPQQNTGIAYDRVPGPPLDALGQSEAQLAARFLQPLGLQALLCSPLVRTRQTADAIAAATGLTPLTVDLLAEHRSDEAFDAVRARCATWLSHAESGPHATLAVVTHGSPVRALLGLLSRDALDLTRHSFAGGNPSPTAGIWRADRTSTGWLLSFVFEPQAVSSANTPS
jgi:broad specificity phosphatase PhoE